MTVFLGILVTVASLLVLAAGATVFQLRSSDPAGNGLAEVFLVGTVIGLWLTIGIMLLVAELALLASSFPGGTINLWTGMLFVVAAGSQLASLSLLTGRQPDGWYRLVLQLALIVVPVGAIVHAIWRGFGGSIPENVATTGVAAAVIGASLVPWPRLIVPSRPPAAAPVDPFEGVVFPGLLIQGTAGAVEVGGRDDPGIRASDPALGRGEEPILVDSRLEMFVVRETGGVGSDVRLVPWEPDGTADNVRRVLLRVTRFASDPGRDSTIRAKLTTATTVAEMIGALRGR